MWNAMDVSPIAEHASEVVLALSPDTSAPRRARRALHDAHLPEDLQHTVDLLATELIANSVRHAQLAPEQRIVFAARFVSDYIHVEIADPGQGFDPDTAMSGRGFGLRMVDKLASRWGAAPSAEGFRVWFEVDRRSTRRRFDR
jgi:anti-sigma regulatory factor (Ser/Thr protein kinase)